jgi:major type 1 subunit fimbrin (pilin)
MKTCKVRALFVMAAVCVTPLAVASDGTINFNGELVAQTCTVAVNGVVSPAISTVTLPTISNSLLTTAGQVAGQTGFSIELSKCSGSAKTAAAFFESGASVDPVTGNLNNLSGTATEVQLQLVDASNGSKIKAGDTMQSTATSRLTLDESGAAFMPYAVQYFASGTTTPGTVVSSVTYSVNYQ